MFVEGLENLLANNPTIQATLGVPRKNGDNGVFPSTAPDQVQLPYVVYTQVHREPVLSYQGVNAFQEVRFQLSCYGGSYKTVKTLANNVKNLLDGFTGLLSEGTVVGQTIPVSEHDSAEPVFHATVYGVILDYSFLVIANAGQ